MDNIRRPLTAINIDSCHSDLKIIDEEALPE